MSRRDRRASLTPEERYARSVSARRKFKALVRLIISNLTWLQEMEDEKLGDNVKRNIQVLTRKKGKKSQLTLKDKAVLNKPQELRTDAEKTHLRRIIGNLKCFRRYPPDVKNQLPGIMYFQFYGPNRVIVKQDYEPLNLYVILTGEVLISQVYYDRLLKEYLTKDIMLMGPGSYFGEVSLLHGINRTATVSTTQASEFLIIKREDFDRVLKSTVQEMWEEMMLNMSWFSYFKDWTPIEIRESCVLGRKKNFEPDQIILSSTGGSMESVYFVTKGSCYLMQYMKIRTTYRKGIPHHFLIKDDGEPEKPIPPSLYKQIKRLHKPEESQMNLGESLRPAIRISLKKMMTLSEIWSMDQSHFFRVCTFNRLACFNVGENLKNRIIVAGPDAECLLLPRYFLMDKSMLTFKSIEHYLNRHIPTPEQIFKNFLEEARWTKYKEELVETILSRKSVNTFNTIHNVPYLIRLAEDLGEW